MKFHHYGLVVRDIKKHYDTYLKHNLPFGYGDITHDPTQKVNVCFIEGPGGCVELVEPCGEDSPVAKVLEKNLATYHHICMEVPDLDKHLEKCRDAGQFIVCPPTPATAFGGRRIAFVVGRDKLLWEFLEE